MYIFSYICEKIHFVITNCLFEITKLIWKSGIIVITLGDLLLSIFCFVSFFIFTFPDKILTISITQGRLSPTVENLLPTLQQNISHSCCFFKFYLRTKNIAESCDENNNQIVTLKKAQVFNNLCSTSY